MFKFVNSSSDHTAVFNFALSQISSKNLEKDFRIGKDNPIIRTIDPNIKVLH